MGMNQTVLALCNSLHLKSLAWAEGVEYESISVVSGIHKSRCNVRTVPECMMKLCHSNLTEKT